MALANSSFKVMSLTDAAAARVREIMENSDKPVLGLRVGVKVNMVFDPPWDQSRMSDIARVALDMW